MPLQVTVDAQEVNWQSVEYGFGGDRDTNPRTPTVDVGRGRLTVSGTPAFGRVECVVSVGETKLWECWAEHQKTHRHQHVQYDLLGKLDDRRAFTLSSGGDSNANQFADRLAAAFGVAADEVTLKVGSTPFRPFEFAGTSGGFAALYSLAAGGTPIATVDGGLLIVDPVTPPSDRQTLNLTNNVYDAYSDESDFRLWNRILVPHDTGHGIVETTVDNPVSIAEWGLRTLDLPDFVSTNATALIRSRLNNLAQPRYLHDVELDAGLPANQTLNPGDFVNARIVDAARQVNINAVCLVLHASYRLNRLASPVKHLVLVESGTVQPANAPIITEAGSDITAEDGDTIITEGVAA
ncbi:MAG: hypothetical protein OXG44_10675 [Gammaproteobacteria bacterium]|nr:hypothetical protein [Gammaproteobacteria bacterium]